MMRGNAVGDTLPCYVEKRCKFKLKDLVWKKSFILSNKANYINSKLQPKFVGPYVITKFYSPSQVELSTIRGKSVGRWPTVHLKSFVS